MKKLCMILPMALILCFMVGCQDKAAMAELEEFKAQAEVEEQNKALAKRYVETFNKGDFEAFKELLSPGYAVYNPSGTTKSTSREKLIESYKMAQDAFTEFTWSIEEMIAAGDKVVCRIIARGTYKGGVESIPVSEKELEFSLINIMRIENGKVVEEWQEDDQLGLARQLGMELKPKGTE
ncbi:MAG: ester cyclase [Candidatus Aminicenantes bacterium]|nr:MAG: ester cyclase [Candidatus Aminicenantes bacterium]